LKRVPKTFSTKLEKKKATSMSHKRPIVEAFGQEEMDPDSWAMFGVDIDNEDIEMDEFVKEAWERYIALNKESHKKQSEDEEHRKRRKEEKEQDLTVLLNPDKCTAEERKQFVERRKKDIQAVREKVNGECKNRVLATFERSLSVKTMAKWQELLPWVPVPIFQT